MGCHFLLHGIFPTQGSNLGLPHCRQMLYSVSHQGRIMGAAMNEMYQLIEKRVWSGHPACLLKTHPHTPSLAVHQGSPRPLLWALPVSSGIPAACLLTSGHSHWSFRRSASSSGKDWRWELALIGVRGLEAQCLKNLTALQHNLH